MTKNGRLLDKNIHLTIYCVAMIITIIQNVQNLFFVHSIYMIYVRYIYIYIPLKII